MAKYNRLCVSISDETDNALNLIVEHTNKKIKALSKSAIVEIALVKFFADADVDRIVDEIEKQIMVE